MFAMKLERVEEWVARDFPGETFETHLFASLFSPQYSAPGSHTISSGDFGDSERAAFVQSLELDEERKIGFLEQHTVYALTNRQLCIANIRGFRPRPKDLLQAGPREGLKVYWYDGRVEAGNQFRHFVFVFADGMWRGDRTGGQDTGTGPQEEQRRPLCRGAGPRRRRAALTHAGETLLVLSDGQRLAKAVRLPQLART